MTPATPAVWSVTVAYRSRRTIEATLRSALEAGAARAVVVDNGSDDGSLEVAAATDPLVLAFSAGGNLGFGAGCNRGVAQVPSEVPLVLFLNPDATIERADLDLLVAHLRDNPTCALVAPAMARGSERLASHGSSATFVTEARAFLPRRLWPMVRGRRADPGADMTGPVAYVEGACMLVRRGVLDAVGGFDERYFLYFEELDLGNRLRAAGYEVHLCAEATAQHLVGTAISGTAHGGRPFLYESTTVYLRRWRPAWEARAYRVALAVGFGLRSLVGQTRPAELLAYVKASRGRPRRADR